ncbi:MAG: 6-phosphogluconolactonase [Methylococcales bacterium]|nr:6-phosphogluconolactonase [Methylococcales bacterium]
MQSNIQWHQSETTDLVEQEVCERILELAKEAIAARGQFKFVLAGGKTPEKVYRLLAKSDTNWSKWFIYHGDERVLPASHPDRNSVMARGAFLNLVAIPKNQIFDMPTELGTEESAAMYRPIVQAAMPFDLVLLGMGEDGHIASLFPNHTHDENDIIHSIYNSPKPPSERVTLSAKALSNTQNLFFLIQGTNKHHALKRWCDGEALPVAKVSALQNLVVFLDQAAADID